MIQTRRVYGEISRPVSRSMSYPVSGRIVGPSGLPVVVGTITIGNVVQHQAFQRTAPIAISGTYTVSSGELVAVQVRHAGGSWMTLDAAPAAGAFSGAVTLPAGVGTLEVRLNDSASTGSVSDVLVGEVFVIAGQSNAQGQGTSAQTYGGTLGSKRYRAGAWSNTADPVGANTSNGSPYPMLATLLEDELGIPIAFVAGDTVGGTGLLFPDADWSPGGDNYENTVNIVNASGINGARAILWYQGERDASLGRSQTDYQNGLSAMLDAFQADCLSLSSAKLVAALIGEASATDAQINAIRAAVINRWETDADIFPGPTAHAVFDPSDNLHWITVAEMERLSRMWARTILGNFFSGESPRGPRVASTVVGDGTTYTTSQIAITFTGGVGNLTNGTSTPGWLVSDYNGSRTVVSASASGNTLVLTCDQELVSAVTISYASGDDARQSTITDSGTIVGLAPEPIISRAAGNGVAIDTLLENLLGWYELETLTADSSPLARTLTNNNTVTSATGKVGSCGNFVSASLQYLSRASDITTALGTGFSVSCWFKTSTAANQALVTKSASLATNGQFGIILTSAGRVQARVFNNPGSSGFLGRQTNTGLADGNWHHVIVTYDGTGTSAGIKIYVDGAQADTANNESGTWVSINSTAAAFEIGRANANASHMNGQIDEVAWWNKVLTSTERTRLYNSGNGMGYP